MGRLGHPLGLALLKGGDSVTKIRELRQDLKRSILSLSYDIRVSASTISAIERRRMTAPARVKEALCSFFNLPEGEIFDKDSFAI